jgi:hypothetical protein
VPPHATDDQTAIEVVDGAVEVISEGRWKLLPPIPRDAADALTIVGLCG